MRANKLLYASFVGAMALSSCSQDVVGPENRDADIMTYGVEIPSQSRAGESFCQNALPANFNLYARYSAEADKLYIDGDLISHEGNSWTNTTGLRYWPQQAIDIYGVRSHGAFAWTEDNLPSVPNFTVADDVTAQKDLIFSTVKGATKPGDYDGTVNLNFRHALSQLCFKVQNTNQNLSVEVSSVGVAYVKGQGTFVFGQASTDGLNEWHNDAYNTTGTLVDKTYRNGEGVWTLEGENKTFEYTLPESVILNGVQGANNLTCPGDNHGNGFLGVMNLIPQTVAKWNPKADNGADNGAYFLIGVTFRNIVNGVVDADHVIYEGKTAIPVDIDWEQGYRYIYNLKFGEGDGGYQPGTDKPVMVPVKIEVEVDDFIPVEGGDINMDTDKEGQQTENKFNLVYALNDINATAEGIENGYFAAADALTHDFTVTDVVPVCPGKNFLGWAESAAATEATLHAGDIVTVAKNTTKTIFAVWEADEYDVTVKFVDAEGNVYTTTTVKANSKDNTINIPAYPDPTARCYGVNTEPGVFTGMAGSVVAVPESKEVTVYAFWKFLLAYHVNANYGAYATEGVKPNVEFYSNSNADQTVAITKERVKELASWGDDIQWLGWTTSSNVLCPEDKNPDEYCATLYRKSRLDDVEITLVAGNYTTLRACFGETTPTIAGGGSGTGAGTI